MTDPERQRATRPGRPRRFLTIDVGGSGLKAAVVDRDGRMLTERVRIKTPADLTPQILVAGLKKLVEPLGTFDRVSVGFPGVVRGGTIVTAPNLGTKRLRGCDLARALQAAIHCPVRVANDAVVQGLAAIRGEGIELVITLGTGFGTAVFDGGRPLPTLELAHHPFRKGDSYEDQLGNAALRKVGKKRWNRRLDAAIRTLRGLFGFDRLYIGGGECAINHARAQTRHRNHLERTGGHRRAAPVAGAASRHRSGSTSLTHR